jgi:hypothetical protein
MYVVVFCRSSLRTFAPVHNLRQLVHKYFSFLRCPFVRKVFKLTVQRACTDRHRRDSLKKLACKAFSARSKLLSWEVAICYANTVTRQHSGRGKWPSEQFAVMCGMWQTPNRTAPLFLTELVCVRSRDCMFNRFHIKQYLMFGSSCASRKRLQTRGFICVAVPCSFLDGYTAHAQ